MSYLHEPSKFQLEKENQKDLKRSECVCFQKKGTFASRAVFRSGGWFITDYVTINYRLAAHWLHLPCQEVICKWYNHHNHHLISNQRYSVGLIISIIDLKGSYRTKGENNLAADRRWYFTAIKRPTSRVRRMGSFAWRGSKAFGIMIWYCNFFSQFLSTWGWGRFHREGWQEGVIRQGDNYWWRGVLASYCHNVIAVIINVVIVNINLISCSSTVIVIYGRASSRHSCYYHQ